MGDFARLDRLIGPSSRRALRYRVGEPELTAGRDGEEEPEAE